MNGGAAVACPSNPDEMSKDVPMIHDVIDWRDKINFLIMNLTCGNYGPLPRELLDDLLRLSNNMNSRLYMEFMFNYNPR